LLPVKKQEKSDLDPAFSFVIRWCVGNQGNKITSQEVPTEAEFYALLEGITDVEFLQDIIHFAYKVDKRIFNCKNTTISAGKIVSSIETIARTKHIEVAHLWIQQEVAKERIQVHYVNTENQADDILTKSLVRLLFENCKKRLGLISSKEMWLIISFFCLTCCTILRGGQLRNCVSRFWYKISWMLEIFWIKNRNVGILKDQIYSICQSGFRFWSWWGCQWEATSRIRRRIIIYITEVVYTVPNRSSVHSICDRPYPRWHVNCIH
jgi:hypothetical protein